jgi:hypothetical protein
LIPEIPEGWVCPKRTGFLFPHQCDRLTPIGCPNCQNGQLADPYKDRTDRDSYSDYDDYDSSVYLAGALGVISDFTEGDGENLVRPDEDFEDDLTES